ncbi:hypothetical protein WHZ77_19325 [Bradyrhizobium sp. A5]|uniref:hypothetical protein n=1 Tax=Bradyrhizobium sp. A5 TaxID=3133696 RepID=UPI00324E58CC
MLDRTMQETFPSVDRRDAGGYIVALAFFGAAGTAMIAWIAAIVWVNWRLVEWMLV